MYDRLCLGDLCCSLHLAVAGLPPPGVPFSAGHGYSNNAFANTVTVYVLGQPFYSFMRLATCELENTFLNPRRTDECSKIFLYYPKHEHNSQQAFYKELCG
jgi:hypothetical protein